MSSYLLFLAVGEFNLITTRGRHGGSRGDEKRRWRKGRFALDAEAQILPYYNDYFG